MKRKGVLVGVILLIVCFTYGCGAKKNPSSADVASESTDILEIINDTECDEELLKEIILYYSEILQKKQVVHNGIKYSCISVYNNKELGMIDFPVGNEKTEILSDKYKVDDIYGVSEADYVLSIQKSDDRFNAIKNSFISILVMHDENDALIDTIVYEGAISSRLKVQNNDVIWEIQEIENIQCDYANHENTIICKERGAFDSKIYNILISDKHLAKSIEEIADEKDVYWECKEEEHRELSCIYAENREITMREIIADEEVSDAVKNEIPFPISIEKYGLPYRNTGSGVGGDIFVTKDGYVIISSSLYLEYYKMTREELNEVFEVSVYSDNRGRYGTIETEEKRESIFNDNEINPELLKVLEN